MSCMSKKMCMFAQLSKTNIMEEKEKMAVELPENAFRELKEGEEYQPIMKPHQVYPEVNGWSVTWGILIYCAFPISNLMHGPHNRQLL